MLYTNRHCSNNVGISLQITGEFEAVQEALLQITTRLRHHLFRDKFLAMSQLPHPAFPDQAPPFVPYMGRRDGSPPRMYHNLGSSFHKFEPVGGFPPHDERSAFLHGIHRPGIRPHGSDRMPSSAPWGPQVPVCFLSVSVILLFVRYCYLIWSVSLTSMIMLFLCT